MREQGALVSCVYCTQVHPELKGKKECPQCHGQVEFFRPMRMMDKQTSMISIMDKIFWLNPDQNPYDLKNALINLLTDVSVYNFNLSEALILYIKDLESRNS